MPILNLEKSLYPDDLLDNPQRYNDDSRSWYCLYTISRREKDLLRKLIARNIACYSPVIPKRYRSPAGRLRTSFVPLFANYAFLFANESERYQSMQTNCISKVELVSDRDQLVNDLRQIQSAIGAGIPLTPEGRLVAGQRARVRSGPFQGYEGEVIRREGKTRLLLTINFLEQGVSMEMDEALLSPL